MVRERYAKAQKVHSILCTAGQYKEEAVRDLYADLFHNHPSLYDYFEAVLVGEAECQNSSLTNAISMRMNMPSYTCEKEIVVWSSTVEETAKKLDALVEQGFQVYVTAPPKYKVTCTQASKAKAEALLATM